MAYRFAFGRDTRVNALLGAGHFLSHFYQLCLPPLFIAWQQAFDVSFAELGLARVELRTSVANTRSRALAERLGFGLEGILHGALQFAHRADDVAFYSITASEWSSRYAAVTLPRSR